MGLSLDHQLLEALRGGSAARDKDDLPSGTSTLKCPTNCSEQNSCCISDRASRTSSARVHDECNVRRVKGQGIARTALPFTPDPAGRPISAGHAPSRRVSWSDVLSSCGSKGHGSVGGPAGLTKAMEAGCMVPVAVLATCRLQSGPLPVCKASAQPQATRTGCSRPVAGTASHFSQEDQVPTVYGDERAAD